MENYFFQLLYEKKHVTDALQEYCEPMLKSSNPIEREIASQLAKYWGLLTNKVFIHKRILPLFATIIDKLLTRYPELSIDASARIKALISAFNKLNELKDASIKELQKSFLKKKFPDECKSPQALSKKVALIDGFDEPKTKLQKEFKEFLYSQKEIKDFKRVKDFFAMRFIIEDVPADDGSATIEGVNTLYEVTNFILDFIQKSPFKLLESDKLIETGKISFNSNLIVVPECSGLKPEYQKYCKDYVAHPKSDGYQSIHFVIVDPFTGYMAEIQIRTRSMEMVANTFANHEHYKNSRYEKWQNKTQSELDLSRITIEGFRYMRYPDPTTGEFKDYISDKAGIIEPIFIQTEFDLH